MDLLKTSDIEKLGIKASNGATHTLFDNLVRWGWVDGLGRSRDWTYWRKN